MSKSKRTGLRKWIAIFLGVLLCALLTPARHATAQTTTIAPSPSSVSIAGCGSVIVDVQVTNVVDLYGIDVTLAFDPTVLEVVDSDPGTAGVQVSAGSFLQGNLYTVRNSANNSTGTIRFATTQLNPTPPASGSGPVVTIEFRARSAGTSPIDIVDFQLAAPGGVEIGASSSNGTAAAGGLGATTTAITRLNNSDVRLSWNAVSDAAAYNIYRDTAPYFTPAPGNLLLSTTATQHDDLSAQGDTANNYFYVVRAACDHDLEGTSTQRVGEFDFELIPGTP